MKTVFINILILFLACNYSYSDDNLQSSSIEFIANKGQWVDCDGNAVPDIKFKANVEEREVYVRNSGLSFVLRKFEPDSTKIEEKKQDVLLMDNEMEPGTVYTHRMDIEFSGANNITQISGMEKLPQYNNYYYPHCADGITHVPVYAKVEYNNVYDNIDLMVYANEENSLEYDFIVKPGANPQKIKLKLIESGNTELSAEGNLIAETILGKIEQMKPYTYQIINGVKKEIKSAFVLDGNQISFEVEKYDRSKELVIDPITKVWATYFGGSGEESCWGAETDDENNIIICGRTVGNDAGHIIASPGSHQEEYGGGEDGDAFIAKFNEDGKRVWSTYYGGDSTDYAYAISIDKDSNIIVGGYSRSVNTNNVIATADAYQAEYGGDGDGMLIKFDRDGTRIWGTYYGGSGLDRIVSSAIDYNNRIIINGTTTSETGISTIGVHKETFDKRYPFNDIYIAKFDFSGNRIWGSYYGGNATELAGEIAVDSNNNIYIVGSTQSWEGISTVNSFKLNYEDSHDVFFTKFNSDGQIIWGSYLGNTGIDKGFAIAVDHKDNIIVAGVCSSSLNFVTENAHQKDGPGGMPCAFINKFDKDCNRLWGTIYGGNSDDLATDIEIDRNNNIFITGITFSSNYSGVHDYISTYDALQRERTSTYHEVLIAKFNEFGTRIWGSYFGSDSSDLGEVIIQDDRDNLILIGTTGSPERISSNDAYQKQLNGKYDAFILKINDPTIDILEIREKAVGGTEIQVTYQSHITSLYNIIYTLQMSDSLGDFNNYSVIGRDTNNKVIGEIITYLPDDIKYGTEYKFRIAASNPDVIGLYYDSAYTLYPKPDMDIKGKTTVIAGKEEKYSVNPSEWYINQWEIQGGEIIGSSDSNEIIIKWNFDENNKILLVRSIESEDYYDTTLLDIITIAKPDTEIKGIDEACVLDTVIYSVQEDTNFINTWKVSGGTISVPENSDSIEVIWDIPGEGFVQIYMQCNEAEYIDSNSIEVTIHPRPEKPIIEQEGTVLVSSSESGNQWYKENILIPDAFENSYIPDESGNYTVRVTNEYGCESEFSDVFEYTKTGIYENTETDGIQIYPNPSNGEITIELNNPEYQYISLSITDIFGREVKSLFSGYKAPGNISFIWNTNAVIDGVYFCRLTLGDESFVKAVVVSR